MSALEGKARGSQASLSPSMSIIDTDVHEYYRSPADLTPYIDPVWAGQTPNPPFYSYQDLGAGFARQDWRLSDGTAGTDCGALASHLFDGEGISIAILN